MKGGGGHKALKEKNHKDKRPSPNASALLTVGCKILLYWESQVSLLKSAIRVKKNMRAARKEGQLKEEEEKEEEEEEFGGSRPRTVSLGRR